MIFRNASNILLLPRWGNKIVHSRDYHQTGCTQTLPVRIGHKNTDHVQFLKKAQCLLLKLLSEKKHGHLKNTGWFLAAIGFLAARLRRRTFILKVMVIELKSFPRRIKGILVARTSTSIRFIIRYFPGESRTSCVTEPLLAAGKIGEIISKKARDIAQKRRRSNNFSDPHSKCFKTFSILHKTSNFVLHHHKKCH